MPSSQRSSVSTISKSRCFRSRRSVQSSPATTAVALPSPRSPTRPRSRHRDMMSKLILINATPEEARVALVENQSLAEMHIERTRDRGIVGNIYKGKVVRVLPGMQAAFVDIGLAKAGFLHVSDFYPGVDELPMIDADAVDRGAGSEPASASALSPTEPPLAAAVDDAPPEPPAY